MGYRFRRLNDRELVLLEHIVQVARLTPPILPQARVIRLHEQLGYQVVLRVPHLRRAESASWVERVVPQRPFQKGLSGRVNAVWIPLLLVLVRHLLPNPAVFLLVALRLTVCLGFRLLSATTVQHHKLILVVLGDDGEDVHIRAETPMLVHLDAVIHATLLIRWIKLPLGVGHTQTVGRLDEFGHATDQLLFCVVAAVFLRV